MWHLLLLLSCAKEIPPHLRVEDATPARYRPPSVTALLAGDPLARRPSPRTPSAWEGLKEADALAIWASTANQRSPSPADWMSVVTKTRGTIGVPLARGAMLAGLEFTQGSWDHPHQQQVAAWLGLTRVAARPIGERPSSPMDWLAGSGPKEKLRNARHLATRMVLTGWLDSPSIDLNAVDLAIQSSAYTRLLLSPTGALIHSRAQDQRSDAARSRGQDALKEATMHALRWVGADTNAQQAVLRQARDTSRAAHGATPEALSLRTAVQALTADAGDPRSAGLALVAITAERMAGTCPDRPCEGLYLTATLQRSSMWGDEAGVLAHIWTLIATKRALDTLEVSLERPSLSRRLLQIGEALSGFTGAPIELAFLRHRSASPALLLSISRMAGGRDVTQAKAALDAVRHRLIGLCEVSLPSGTNPEMIQAIDQIRRRTLRAIAASG